MQPWNCQAHTHTLNTWYISVDAMILMHFQVRYNWFVLQLRILCTMSPRSAGYCFSLVSSICLFSVLSGAVALKLLIISIACPYFLSLKSNLMMVAMPSSSVSTTYWDLTQMRKWGSRFVDGPSEDQVDHWVCRQIDFILSVMERRLMRKGWTLLCYCVKMGSWNYTTNPDMKW